MRIAFVHSFYSSQQPSGENTAVRAEVDALRGAGHDVELFAARTDELEGDRLYVLRTALRVASGYGSHPLRAIEDFEPEVLHIHNLFPNFGRRWVSHLRVPIVHTLHNYRPLCANGMLYRDGQICMLCPQGDRWAGVRYACYRDSRVATIPLAWSNRGGPAADPLIQRADRLLVLSERQRRIYVRAGIPEQRLQVWSHFLPAGLDRGSGPGAGGPGWLFVGRLSEEKGLLRLVRRWPGWRRLVVVGEGPQRGAIEDAARGKRIRLVGALDREGVVSLMRRSVGLVFPSMWFETFGLVYMEAMAAGLPVLAFGANTVADSVRRDGTGIVASWDEPLDAQLEVAAETFVAQRSHCRKVYEDGLTEDAYLRRVWSLYAGLRNA